jgi:hypothetical protein
MSLKKTYNKAKREVYLKDGATEVLRATLQTDDTRKVPVGAYFKFAEFTVRSKKEIKNLIEKVRFLDVTRGGKGVVITYDVKIFEERDGQKDWYDFDGKVPANKELRIGLFTRFTKKQKNKTYEWIPTIQGIEIDEWSFMAVIDAHRVVDAFTSNGSWTAPADIINDEVQVEAWAAGAGGTPGVGGGGGGAYARKTVSVVEATEYDIIVGGVSNEDTDGGDSSFNATTVVAKGGKSGTNGGTGGTAAASTGDNKFSGANGQMGTSAQSGGGGAGDSANGSGTSGGAVNGGYAFSNGNANSSIFGAGGGSGSVVGAKGGKGHIRIIYYAPPAEGYPYITSRSYNRQISNTISHAITMPDGIEAGDLLIIVFTSDGDDSANYSIGEDWNNLVVAQNGTTVSGGIFYKIAEGSDTATISTDGSERSSHVVISMKYADIPTATSANGSSENADPPSHDAGASAKYLWLVTGGWDGSAISGIGIGPSAPPSGYGDFVLQTSASLNDGVMTAVANRNAEIQTENPGTWTSIAEQWVAFTIAVPFDDHFRTAERSAETTGTLSANAERSVESTGVLGGQANRSSQLHGVNTDQAERATELTGGLGAIASRAAEMDGIATTSGERSTEAHGIDTVNSERPAEVTGALGSNAARSAELDGIFSASAERSARLTGGTGFNVIVEINGIDISSQIEQRSVEVIKKMTYQSGTARFNVRKAGSKTLDPAYDDDVIIYDQDEKIFAGKVLFVTQEQVSGAGGKYLTVNCVDHIYELDKQLASRTYTNQTVAAIIANLVSSYAPGFTTNNVSSSFVIAKVVFNQLPVSVCIKRLAETVSYNWYVDEDKDVHFFASFSETAPFDLDDTSGNHIPDSLKRTTDGSEVVNRVKVRGGEYNGVDVYTDDITVVGNDTKTFLLPYRFGNLEVSINTGAGFISQNVGIDNIDTFVDNDVLFNFQEKTIRWETPLDDGDIIRYSGNQKIPVFAVEEDATSIAQYGTIEKLVRDDSIDSPVIAHKRASAELLTFVEPIVDARFRTYRSGILPGMIITAESTIHGFDDDLIVKEVRFFMRDHNNFQYEADLISTKRFDFITLLQKILTPDSRPGDEQETSEEIFTDTAQVAITEEIENEAPFEDFQTITTDENYELDILGDDTDASYVLGPYTPSGQADTKRPGRLGISMHVY